MVIVTLCVVFAAVALGAWGLVSLVNGIAESRLTTTYAAQEDELVDETGFFASKRQLREWSFTAATVLGGLPLLLVLAMAPRYLWVGVLLAGVIGAIGSTLPRQIVKGMARKRVKKFEAQLLDVISTVRSGLSSGRSILQCLESVTHDMPDPVRTEFALFLKHHRMGKDISECAELLRRRMPSDDLGLVLICIQINQKVGGNLGQVLERIEGTIRARFELKGRVDSLTSQGKFEGFVMAAAPFAIAGILLLLDRDLMLPLFTDPIGWIAWGAVFVMEAIAFVMIKVITTVDA